MKIKTSHMILKTNKEVKNEPSKLRGYIGHQFEQYPVLHNHYGKGKFLYSYPQVQYHVLNGQASILGISEGADILKEIAPKINELRLGDSFYNVDEYFINDKEYDVGVSNNEFHYKFLTPWIGLNSNNFEKYKNLEDWKEKKLMLNKIIIGNILSMSKGLGIIADRRIYVKSRLKYNPTMYKGVNMLAFIGEFTVNFKIPDFFGFGKGVSQGFGTVIKIDEKQKD